MKYKLFNPPRLTGKYLDKILERKWLTTGPACRELRFALAQFLYEPEFNELSPERIVLASSATAGWQAVLDLLQARAPDPCNGLGVHIIDATWPGMLSAIDHAGCFKSTSFNGDILVLTDIGGRSPMCPTITLKWHTIVHDACHSWLPDPSADFAIMSFYPTKLVPGAEGGVVVCKREEDARELELRLNCGLAPVFGSGVDRNLAPAVVGRKGNLTDVQAALNIEALERAPQYMEEIAVAHSQLTEAADGLGIPYRAQPIRPYLFQVEQEPSRVPHERKALAERGVPSAWNFPPAGLITLPCFPGLTREQAQDILRTYDEVSK